MCESALESVGTVRENVCVCVCVCVCVRVCVRARACVRALRESEREREREAPYFPVVPVIPAMQGEVLVWWDRCHVALHPLVACVCVCVCVLPCAGCSPRP